MNKIEKHLKYTQVIAAIGGSLLLVSTIWFSLLNSTMSQITQLTASSNQTNITDHEFLKFRGELDAQVPIYKNLGWFFLIIGLAFIFWAFAEVIRAYKNNP